MKIKFTPQQLHHLSRIGLFIILAIVIVLLFPRGSRFNFQFETGKPWNYELITASFDFPIYKTDQQVAHEQELILKEYSPFFKLDTTVWRKQFSLFVSENNKSNTLNPYEVSVLKNTFKKVYFSGIISIDSYNSLSKDKIQNISCILPSRITGKKTLQEVFTPKSAYEEIIRIIPSARSENLNVYLVENLKYDSTTSSLSKKELLKGLSLTSGMVQMGERIIDRGEIVTPTNFQVLKSLQIETEKRSSTIQKSSIVTLGEVIMTLGIITLLFLYISLFRPRIYDNLSHLFFIQLLVVMIVSLTSLTMHFSSFHYYMVPYALLPIIIRVFFDSRTALFAHIITILIVSFMIDNPYQFVVLQITIGMVAVSSLKDMSQRSQLVQTAIYIMMSYIALYLAFQCIAEGDVNRIGWASIINFIISSLFLLLAYILIYFFEKIFNLLSSVTLVELTNINSDLMMEFSERAPGTFQHSLQVSNLATEAAKKINANSLLVRTGALYHDIGKMKHPEYFIENQLGEKNPLIDFDFEEASKIVISHVTDGVEIAKRNHLPEQIINFIATHHGFCKTKYFYNSYLLANPDKSPDEAVFTYPGPLPNSKESAILMMADAVEARSRSLSVYTEESIHEMVETMIDGQIADGQFKEAPITFKDVEIVKKIFTEKLKSFHHSRIVYPELKK